MRTRRKFNLIKIPSFRVTKQCYLQKLYPAVYKNTLTLFGLSLASAIISFNSNVAFAEPVFLSAENTEDPLDAQAQIFSFELNESASIKLTCTDSKDPLEKHEVVSNNLSTHNITIRGFKTKTSYRCNATTLSEAPVSSETLSFKTQPLPEDLKQPKVKVALLDSDIGGYVLYNYSINQDVPLYDFTSHYIVIADQLGNIRWYYKLPYQESGSFIDLDATYVNKKILFGGYAGNTKYRPTYLSLSKVSAWEATWDKALEHEISYTCHHDVGLGPSKTSLFTFAYSNINDEWQSFIVKEIDIINNKVLWYWDGYEDGTLKGILPEGGPENFDPHHANSIDTVVEEDGKTYVYVGLRNTSQVYKIDYETKEVIWTLGIGGDFELLDEEGLPAEDWLWFFNPHDAKRVPNTKNQISLYDNGFDRANYGQDFYSRALRLELDEEHYTAKIVSSYEEDGWEEPWWGSYDVLPNNHSFLNIGHAILGTKEFVNTAFIDLDEDLNVKWRMELPLEKMPSYRAKLINGCDIFNNTRFCK